MILLQELPIDAQLLDLQNCDSIVITNFGAWGFHLKVAQKLKKLAINKFTINVASRRQTNHVDEGRLQM
jgi:hypothetical protein